ncbi:MAG: hypothetical protein J0I23_17335 [Rhizobiales bacterium]|nr:hypothetical protein [Hyphomicrobiales bacterium]
MTSFWRWIYGACADWPGLLGAAVADLQAVKDRDPSTSEVLTPFLYFMGFSALQAYRVGHWLWMTGRRHPARHTQSQISETSRSTSIPRPLCDVRRGVERLARIRLPTGP